MGNKEKSFEDIITELEGLIAEDENGSMPLEKMVTQLERGAALIKHCQHRLSALNSRVEMLFKDDGSSGEFVEFDPENERTQATAKPISRSGKKAASPPPVANVNAENSAGENTQDELPF